MRLHSQRGLADIGFPLSVRGLESSEQRVSDFGFVGGVFLTATCKSTTP